jgi:hypothetical protein
MAGKTGSFPRFWITTRAGRDLANLYGINWDRVQEYDWQRRKGPRSLSRKRTPS